MDNYLSIRRGMDDSVPSIDFSPSGGKDNEYSLERMDVESALFHELSCFQSYSVLLQNLCVNGKPYIENSSRRKGCNRSLKRKMRLRSFWQKWDSLGIQL